MFVCASARVREMDNYCVSVRVCERERTIFDRVRASERVGGKGRRNKAGSFCL